ncbi:MAG: hypothetical protein KBT36_01595 [Kurthia sp.]|nr:hypothetical protein [Candidatus Kurthia equi]
MYFDREENKVYIRYSSKRGKQSTNHYFDSTPIFLQFHPEKTNDIFSVHFAEEAPAWIASYATSNNFSYFETEIKNEKGFALYANSSYYMSDGITIEQKINDWFSNCTEAHLQIKKDLLANSEIVDKNLRYYQTIFEEKYGMSVRPSEYDPKLFAIGFASVSPKSSITIVETTDEDKKESIIARREIWENLKTDLLMVREYPAEDEIVDDNPDEHDVPLVEESSIKIEVPVVTEPSIEIEVPAVTESSIEIEVPVVTEPSIEIEVPVVTEPSIEIEVPVVTEPSIKIEVPVVTEPSVEIEVPVVTEPSVEIEVPVVTESSVEDTRNSSVINEHLIVKKSNKKAGLINGQILFF